MTERTRNYFSKCKQGKQSKNRESTKNTGANAPPIDRISGLYSRISNFLDAKNKAAKPFPAVFVYFQARFDCRTHVLRKTSSAEYANFNLFVTPSTMELL